MTVDRWIGMTQARLPAFQQPELCERLLEQAGSQACDVWRNYLRQYAKDQRDIELHKQCSLEESLQKASCPWPLDFVRGIADRV